MKTRLIYTLLVAAFISVTGCSKDTQSPDNSCEKLSTGLLANDVSITAQGINQLIAQLPSADYTGPNLDKLAEKMSGSCGVITTVTCLNCNHAEPLESELTAHFMENGVEKQKIIVITHTPANKMVFLSMRD